MPTRDEYSNPKQLPCSHTRTHFDRTRCIARFVARLAICGLILCGFYGLKAMQLDTAHNRTTNQ